VLVFGALVHQVVYPSFPIMSITVISTRTQIWKFVQPICNTELKIGLFVSSFRRLLLTQAFCSQGIRLVLIESTGCSLISYAIDMEDLYFLFLFSRSFFHRLSCFGVMLDVSASSWTRFGGVVNLSIARSSPSSLSPSKNCTS
jgi:hypothetical protein